MKNSIRSKNPDVLDQISNLSLFANAESVGLECLLVNIDLKIKKNKVIMEIIPGRIHSLYFFVVKKVFLYLKRLYKPEMKTMGIY